MKIVFNSFANAYDTMLSRILNDPEYVTAPRGQKIKELINVNFTISNPLSNLFRNIVRSVPMKYLANELCLYFSGTCSAELFKKASAFWGTIANEDGTVNSAYGNLIFNFKDGDSSTTHNQWQWAKYSLIKDKDSRQAIMHFNRPNHQKRDVKDFPCTIYCQWFIREDHLDLITYMRSNDIFFGVTFDIPFFMLLMQIMRSELLLTYPNLQLGHYHHSAGSLHAYERDFETLEAMSEEIFVEDNLPLIDVNPRYSSDIRSMVYYSENYTYEGNDPFIKWLDDNRR